MKWIRLWTLKLLTKGKRKVEGRQNCVGNEFMFSNHATSHRSGVSFSICGRVILPFCVSHCSSSWDIVTQRGCWSCLWPPSPPLSCPCPPCVPRWPTTHARTAEGCRRSRPGSTGSSGRLTTAATLARLSTWPRRLARRMTARSGSCLKCTSRSRMTLTRDSTPPRRTVKEVPLTGGACYAKVP